MAKTSEPDVPDAAAPDEDDIDVQIAFLQAIRDVRKRYNEAKANRESDREGWAAAKAEHAAVRSYYRTLREARAAADASVAPAPVEGTVSLHGGGATTTEA